MGKDCGFCSATLLDHEFDVTVRAQRSPFVAAAA
jgi:hypothetical protein